MKKPLPAASAMIVAISVQLLAQHPSMPPGMTHEEHLKQLQREAEMKKRGAAAMGFDQDVVTHHFTLLPDGGSIQVEVNSPADEGSRQAIRSHLRQIASQFAAGDFDAPFATHAEVPPGVSAMQRLKTAITYTYADRPNGGDVRITTTNAEAIGAVHEFLRYQITEHHTGDPVTVAR